MIGNRETPSPAWLGTCVHDLSRKTAPPAHGALDWAEAASVVALRSTDIARRPGTSPRRPRRACLPPPDDRSEPDGFEFDVFGR